MLRPSDATHPFYMVYHLVFSTSGVGIYIVRWAELCMLWIRRRRRGGFLHFRRWCIMMALVLVSIPA